MAASLVVVPVVLCAVPFGSLMGLLLHRAGCVVALMGCHLLPNVSIVIGGIFIWRAVIGLRSIREEFTVLFLSLLFRVTAGVVFCAENAACT